MAAGVAAALRLEEAERERENDECEEYGPAGPVHVVGVAARAGDLARRRRPEQDCERFFGVLGSDRELDACAGLDLAEQTSALKLIGDEGADPGVLQARPGEVRQNPP